MNNIYNYITEYGNNEIKEINELDALIFSRLSYIHIEELLEKLPFRITDLNNYLDNIKISSKDKKLVDLLSHSKRFKDLVIDRCFNVFNEKEIIQFCAITFELPNNSLFIAFRGTDKSMIGLMEDLELSYKEIPSQVLALKYLNDEHRLKKIYLGGHSKGGALALYAFTNTNILMKRKIKKVYNFDGPGLLNSKQSIFNYKIMNYYPDCSVVGRMLHQVGEKEVIKSFKSGLEGHNIYNWQVVNDKFKKSSFTISSDKFKEANNHILKTISVVRRERIITYFYGLIAKGKIRLNEFNLSEIKELINNMPNITKEEKKELMDYIKILIKVLLPEMPKKEKQEN